MTLFLVENREFGWEEIVAAAENWGEWDPFVRETRGTLACLQLATNTNQLPTEEEVKEAVTAFRYAHRLISGEETVAWLDRWGMSLRDLMTYIRGSLLRQRWAGRLDQIITRQPIREAAMTGALKCHAVCSDRLGQWAERLAGRVAFALESNSCKAVLNSAESSPLELIKGIETAFDSAQKESITPSQLTSRIEDHRLEWIRFHCRYVWFGEERIAREAAMCVQEDGLTLDDVARDARSLVQDWRFYLDEIDGRNRPHFLAAREGDSLGPIKMMEGYPLFGIVAKKMPVADDPEIRRRAEQVIMRGLIDQAMSERVTWV